MVMRASKWELVRETDDGILIVLLLMSGAGYRCLHYSRGKLN